MSLVVAEEVHAASVVKLPHRSDVRSRKSIIGAWAADHDGWGG